MHLLSRGAGGEQQAPLEWLTGQRLLFASHAIVLVYVAFVCVWAWVGKGFSEPSAGRPGGDFTIFWAASHVILHGSPWQVYDHQAFTAAQLKLFGGFANGYSLPLVYPPAYLLFLAPFCLLPFGAAYLLFVAAGVFLFTKAVLAVSRLDECIGVACRMGQGLGSLRSAAIVIAALPCVFIAAVIGQNSLFTAALAAFAVFWLDKRPICAGLCVGLLVMKPQLAIVFPFVLIAARAWKVIGVAAATALAATLLGVFVGGVNSIEGFLVNGSLFRSTLIEHGQLFWFTSPTPYSALRTAGFAAGPAYTVQAAVAGLAIWAAVHVWRTTRDVRLRASILVVAALLASPYAWH
jgi:hypothetical protein